MDITIPILILAIPLFMFIFLGLVGVKMSHKLAGTLGTLGMGTVLILSYYTAFTYYFSGNPAFIDGTNRLQAVIFDQTWLQFTPSLAIKLGFLLDPIAPTRGGHQHFSDVYLLGACGCIIIPSHRFLLHSALSSVSL